MKKELGALILATAAVAGCTSNADAEFIKNAKYGVEITISPEIFDCYSNVRPTIIYSSPDPEIRGEDFKCKIVQGMDMPNINPDSLSLLVDKVVPLRGDVEEKHP